MAKKGTRSKGEGSEKGKGSRNGTAKHVGKTVLDRVKEPKIEKTVDKIEGVIQKVLLVIFIIVIIGILPAIMLGTFIIIAFIDWIWDIHFNYLVLPVIFIFLEIIAFVIYVLVRREVREEIEEKLYVDNFLATFFTGTIEIVVKITFIAMAVVLVVGGIISIVLVMQFKLYVGSVAVCFGATLLIGIGITIVLVCGLIKFVIKYIIGKTINKLLSKIPHPAADVARKYTKSGEKHGKE